MLLTSIINLPAVYIDTPAVNAIAVELYRQIYDYPDIYGDITLHGNGEKNDYIINLRNYFKGDLK